MRAGGFLDMLIGGLMGGDDGGPPPIKNMPSAPEVQPVSGGRRQLPGLAPRDMGGEDDRAQIAQNILKGGGL